MKSPALASTRPPPVCAADLVMMLTTPFIALAPHSEPPGPLITSMRSTSASTMCCWSQNTLEKNGVYTLRPSISTSSLFAALTEFMPCAEIE